MEKRIQISSNKYSNKYYIDISDKSLKIALNERFQNLKKKYNQILFIIDKNIYKIYEDYIPMSYISNVIIIPPKEKTKSLKYVEKIVSKLTKNNYDKGTLIISMGGGIIGDLSGFVSFIYKRGVDYYHIPTSLLSMVDSSIGGKTGVNFKGIKNLMGLINRPTNVYINVNFLDTLSKTEQNIALGEIIKYALIKDSNLFFIIKTEIENDNFYNNKDLLKMIIYECLRIKIKIVSMDEYSNNIRHGLNFGHTFAHALEQKNIRIKHGEAVLIGIIISSYISHKLGYLDYQKYRLIYELIINNNLINKKIKEKIIFDLKGFINGLVKHIYNDKKIKNGNIDFVFLKDIGEMSIKNISLSDLEDLVLNF